MKSEWKGRVVLQVEADFKYSDKALSKISSKEIHDRVYGGEWMETAVKGHVERIFNGADECNIYVTQTYAELHNIVSTEDQE